MAVSFHTEECTFLPQGRRRITAWIKEVITAEGYSPGDIAYIFCSPEYHIGINRQYLGHDYHTEEERAMRALEDRSLAAYRQANGDYPPFVLPAR